LGRKKKEEEHENHERWLVSYADFMTLLFAFFTTLYAISTVDAQKAGKMVQSMRASFDNTVFPQGSKTLSLSQGQGSGEGAVVAHQLTDNIKLKNLKVKVLNGDQELGTLKRKVEANIGTELLKGIVRTHLEPRGLIISLGEGGFFDSGSDQIKPDGKVLLDAIAANLVTLGNLVRIEGHTDNVPIRNSKFPSNWELSTARATAITRRIIEKFGFRGELLESAGCAEYKPVAPNETEEGRARNRRVDIVVLNPLAGKSEPK
jgi:chemotaxis protein MotB